MKTTANLSWGALVALLMTTALAHAQDIEEVTVHAPRLENENALEKDRLTQENIEKSPAFRLDDILLKKPSFSLFRRANSLSAHPTTQGPSLAALGANGAARALVLLDGIPLNDPFGGWVYWSAIDPGLLGSVSLMKGGSSGAWGSGSLSGTIEMVSRTPDNTLETDALGGSFGTYNLKGWVSFQKNQTAVVLGGGVFDTNGFFLIPQNMRGAVDVRATSRAKNFSTRVSTPLSGQARIEFHARYYSEERINGLLFSTNKTEAVDAGIRLIQNQKERAFNWEANVYIRDRQFENSFASVDNTRTTTRQVLDQFDVPASEIGANARFRNNFSDSFSLEGGFDIRFLKGFTNENARNLGAGFTRLRVAGGNQTLGGLFLEASKTLDEGRLEIFAGARLDYWSLQDGVIRVESLEVPGQVVRDDQISDRNNLAPTGKVGTIYKLSPTTTLSAFFFTGFRVPTLNEFFRPFRVGNDITEANPLLNPEKLKGFEVGLSSSPHPNLEVDFAFTLNRVKGSVGNITLAFGPGFFPPTGLVPAGGVLRQRQNVELISNKAFETYLRWTPANNIEISFTHLFQKSVIKQFAAMSNLVGNQLIQAPKHKAVLSVQAELFSNLFFSSQVRFESKQFDDDQNIRVLPAIWVADITIRYDLSEKVSLSFSALNVFDERVVSALNAAGLQTLAQPRMVLAGAGVRF